jgi:hypothetical protein
VSNIIGKALTQPNSFNNAHFHSITGKPARPQIFHNPNTADPSDITATVFALRV